MFLRETQPDVFVRRYPVFYLPCVVVVINCIIRFLIDCLFCIHLWNVHGAVGDGKTLNTECLQGVIDELHAHGGGQAYFPAGRYLTGSLQLKSGVTLYLERGAVLLGSTSPYDYPHVEPQSDLKVNDDHFNQALIYADGAERIGIMGYGTVDGQGTGFGD